MRVRRGIRHSPTVFPNFLPDFLFKRRGPCSNDDGNGKRALYAWRSPAMAIAGENLHRVRVGVREEGVHGHSCSLSDSV
jgi:hypothetical protein